MELFEPFRKDKLFSFNQEFYIRWSSLSLFGDAADPFSCGPAWQLCAHTVLDPQRKTLICSGPDSVLAFAVEYDVHNIPLLVPLETSWMFGAPLIGPRAEELFLSLLEPIDDYFGRLPVVCLSGIREHDMLPQRLARQIGRHCMAVLYGKGGNLSASLAGGMDGYLSRRSANFRSKQKKALRRAAENGVTFERYIPAGGEEAASLYARIQAVEERSWKGRDDCGITTQPSKDFYETLLQLTALEGAARVIMAKQEGRDVGFIFGTMAGKIYRGQQFSYDADLGALSIGDCLQMQQLLWLCEEGCIRYDMGMGDDPRMAYKTHWTENDRLQQTWCLLPY